LADNKGFYDGSPIIFSDLYPTVNSKSLYATVHPNEDRWLTVREFMHAMSLPDDFDLISSKSDGKFGGEVNHIAQNVSVNTSAWFTTEIQNYLDGKLEMTKHKHIIIDNASKRIEPTQLRNGESKGRKLF
jgi:hypothetical protein